MWIGFSDGDGGVDVIGLPVGVLEVMVVDFAVAIIRVNLMRADHTLLLVFQPIITLGCSRLKQGKVSSVLNLGSRCS